ncbi:MAG: FKBP-type peptidyl-prolyl cis-trans isomerase [Lachnospiraceae bacterium]|nr:FKBP-type peptidyl-prolyl cis-trans isomerase [Lachnospiraceae bacterium]
MGNTEEKKARKAKALKKAKMQKSIVTIVSIVVALAVVGCIAWVVIYALSFRVKETDNYSIGLNDDGMIAGVKATDYVTLCDYNNITAEYSELAPSDEAVQSYIDGILRDYKAYTMDLEREVKMGDSINIDYVGSIGGVEFDGGSTQGKGTDIVVGQAGFIDDFEEQLCGHKAGDKFAINVTFPEEYGNAEVAGKDAVFQITINGIYEEQEFNDEFVKTYLSEEARTADAFIQKYKDEEYEKNLNAFLQNYVNENSTVNSYPESYIKGLMALTKGSDINQYESYNKYYASTYGQAMYNSFDEYTGLDKKEYYAQLRTQAEKLANQMLVYQAIYEDAGLTVTDKNVEDVFGSYGITDEFRPQMEETYGKGFLNQSAIMFAVLDYLKEHVTVNGLPE